VEADNAGLRWGVERRLEFIEFRLFWEGHVNRGDLMDAFGVSVNQASTDLNRYIAMAPNNMAYDKSSRTYIRSSGFSARFLEPDASLYLSKLRSVADGIVDRSDTWIGKFPSYDCAPTPVRGVAVSGCCDPSLRSDRDKISVDVAAGACLALDCAACNRLRWLPLAREGLLPVR